MEIAIVPFKERMVGNDIFRNKVSAARITTQTEDDRKFSCQNKYSAFQRMDDCHCFCDKNRCTTSKT